MKGPTRYTTQIGIVPIDFGSLVTWDDYKKLSEEAEAKDRLIRELVEALDYVCYPSPDEISQATDDRCRAALASARAQGYEP